MPSTPASKRASLPRASDFTKEFLKDWKRLSASGRFNMADLKTVMLALIADEGPLAPERKDRPLQGKLGAYRECHIGGDFLLVYELDDDSVIFVRAGTHADLFE